MFEIVKQDILKFLSMYLEEGCRLAAAAFFLTFLIGGCCARKCEKRQFFCLRSFLVAADVALLAFYVYTVIGITLLSRIGQSVTYVNLCPFSSFDPSVVDPKYIYENLLLFVPFGMLLYPLAEPFREAWAVLLIGAGCSLAIEVAQLVTKLGCFIVDDIVTNTAGMLAGYFVCRCTAWIAGRIGAARNRNKFLL